MSKAQAAVARRNLGLGYALPIIGGAISLIIGLVVWDLTHTTFDAWIWILIIAILGISLVFGTSLSNAAFNFAEPSGKAVGSIRGAKNLNFVLGIIWSAVVTVKSFSDMGNAVNQLRGYRSMPVPAKQPKGTAVDNAAVYTGSTVKPLTWHFFIADFLPAFVLLVLVVVGIYLLLWERAKPGKVTKSATPSEDK